MKKNENLLRFAKASFFLLLSILLILAGNVLSGGSYHPIAAVTVYVGLFLAVPGILYGVAAFGNTPDKTQETKESQNSN